jgi:5-oxoprolinase (ATP-hydrolysing) subunit A
LTSDGVARTTSIRLLSIIQKEHEVAVKKALDLNADCGESFGAFVMGQDPEMVPLMTSVNLACGFHGGDPTVMIDSVELAMRSNCLIGAHIGLPDLLGFGRRRMMITPKDMYAYVSYQISALAGIVKARGGVFNHVKPHGAMFYCIQEQPGIGEAVAQAVMDTAPDAMAYWPLVGASDQYIATLRRNGYPVLGEIYPDLTYYPDGRPIGPKKGKEARDPALTAKQVELFLATGTVEAVDGSHVEIEADAICLHSDDPNGPANARAVRETLKANGCALGLNIPEFKKAAIARNAV